MYQPPPAALDPDAEAALVRTASGFRLRPLDLTDILDEIFKIYRANFPLFAGISVLLNMPQVALNMVTGNAGLYGSLIDALKNPNGAPPPPALPDPGLVVFGTLAVYLVLLLILPFTVGAVTAGACFHVMGQPVTWAAVLRACFSRYGWLLLFGIIGGLSVLFLCLLPLWIWLAVRVSVVLPAMFVERIGLFDGFGRSWQLVESRWWRTFGILLLVGLLYYFVSYVLTWSAFLFLVTAVVLPGWAAAAIVFTALTVANGLVVPIIHIAIVLIYFDLRVRREGLDLQLLALRTLAQPAAAPAPGA